MPMIMDDPVTLRNSGQCVSLQCLDVGLWDTLLLWNLFWSDAHCATPDGSRLFSHVPLDIPLHHKDLTGVGSRLAQTGCFRLSSSVDTSIARYPDCQVYPRICWWSFLFKPNVHLVAGGWQWVFASFLSTMVWSRRWCPIVSSPGF